MTPDPFEPIAKARKPLWRTLLIWGVVVPVAVLSLLAIAGLVYLLGFEHY